MEPKSSSPGMLTEPQPSLNRDASSSVDITSTQPAITFSDLPFEIRTGIYKLAIPRSRVLRMRLVQFPNIGRTYAESISAPCIPTILHINHESRTVGLSIFKFSFGIQRNDTPRGVKGTPFAERVTYWNPQIDTLYLPYQNPPLQYRVQETKDFGIGPDSFLGEHSDYEHVDSCLAGSDIYHQQHILQHIRHIALISNRTTQVGFGKSTKYNYDEYGSDRNLPAWLQGFKNLKSITILDDHYPDWYRSGEILLHEPTEDSSSLQRFKKTENIYVQGLEKFAREKGWEGELPSVELLIMTNRKVRKVPAFCVRPEKVGNEYSSILN